MSSNYRPLNHSSEDISMSEIGTSYNHGAQHSMANNGQQAFRNDAYSREPKSRMFADSSSQLPPSMTSKTNLRTIQRKHGFFAIWWKEFIACFLVVAAAFATFGTLYPYQGKPLPQWPYLITVNALISAYMVVLKASATFLLAEGIGQQKWKWFYETERPLYDLAIHDEATRGPWGALKLLTRASFAHVWHWLGCILILLALFVDPFTQQVLHYKDCNVLDDAGKAMIPRTNFFAAGGPHLGARQVTITSDEQASVNAGVSAPGAHVDQQCTSGNCTFPTYSTIGYCSSCEDISQAVKFEWLNYTDLSNQSHRGIISYIEDGLTVEFIKMMSSNFSALADLGDNFQFLVGIPTDGSDSQSAAHAIDPVTEKQPIGCSDSATNGTWRCQGYGAANCALYPCMRTYNASVRNGVLQENLVRETAQNPFLFGYDDAAQYLATLNASCLTADEKSLLTSNGYTINSGTDWIPYNISFSPLSNQSLSLTSNTTEIHDFETAVKQRGCMYAIENDFVISLTQDFLDHAWTGTLTGFWNTDAYGVALFEGPQMLQQLFNFGQFGFERTQSMFKNVSESLTNHMRMNPNFEGPDLYNLGKAATGDVYREKTCLRVEWPWLAMPFALVAFTLLFFVGVLLSQGALSGDVRTWKSSTLPLIFHGPRLVSPGWRSGHDGVGLQSMESMEAVAKGMNVRLVHDEDGELRLRERFGEKST